MDKQDKQELERRLDRRSLLVGGAGLVGALSLGPLLAGCGGGSNQIQNPGPGNGRALLTIAWPDRTRLIPAAGGSIKLTVTAPPRNPGEPPIVSERLVVRPPGEGAVTSTEVFDSLPTGNVTVTTFAYPTADGTGVVQAAASFVVAIRRNEDTSTALSLGTTIDRIQIQITPATTAAPALSLPAGSTAELVASALDAGGAVVITSVKSWTWTMSNAAAATLSASGERATLTGVSVGSVTVRVVERESGKSAETTVSVSRPPVLVGLADSPWPKLRGNSRNSGQGKGSGAKGVLKWKLNIGNAGVGFDPSPAIGVDGTIYVGSRDGYLYAVSPEGSLKWRFRTARVASPSSNQVASPLIGADGTIYVSASSAVYALNADGTLQWRVTIDGVVAYRSPALGNDGTIYVGGSSIGGLWALNADGSTRWQLRSIEAGNPEFALGEDGTLFFVSRDHSLVALSPQGTLKWQLSGQFSEYVAPAVGGDGTIYLGSSLYQRGDGNPGDLGGYLSAVSPDGTLKWRYDNAASGLFDACSIGSDGVVYVGSQHGPLYALNPDGTLRWQRHPGGRDGFTSSTSIAAIGAEGTIFVNSFYGVLHSFTPEGNVLWKYQMGERGAPVAIGGDGTLYCAVNDGYLYALK